MHRLAPLAAFALMIAAAAPTVVAAQTAAASPGVIELGVDAGVSTTLGGDYRVTTVSIPTSSIRAGFYINNHVSFEPQFGLTSLNASGDHYTTYNASIGVLLHGNGDRVGAGLYLRPFAGLTGISTNGSSSETQTNVGAGLGVSIPFAERLATRLEVAYEHGFASTYTDKVNMISATVGLSFFNH